MNESNWVISNLLFGKHVCCWNRIGFGISMRTNRAHSSRNRCNITDLRFFFQFYVQTFSHERKLNLEKQLQEFIRDEEGTCGILKPSGAVYYYFLSRSAFIKVYCTTNVWLGSDLDRFRCCVHVCVLLCVNMCHAFPLIGIWCVFIGALINVLARTHLLHSAYCKCSIPSN